MSTVLSCSYSQVVTRIITYYKLKNSDTLKSISRGNGGTEVGKIVLNDGQYLKKIDMQVGSYLDWIQFTDTDGNKSSRFGGDTNKGPNRSISWQNGVIKSLRGKAGNVIDRIMAYGELNQIYSARMLDPTFTIKSYEIDDSADAPDDRLTLDNRNGLTEQTATLKFSETVRTNEVTTVTKNVSYLASMAVTTSVGFNYGFASGGIESTFQVGTSWSDTLEDTNEEELATTVQREIPLTAPPRTLAVADVYVDTVHYEFVWEAPTVCTYTYAPKAEVDGDSFEGTVAGSQPFEEVKVVYSYVRAPTVQPTGAPTPSVSRADAMSSKSRSSLQQSHPAILFFFPPQSLLTRPRRHYSRTTGPPSPKRQVTHTHCPRATRAACWVLP